MGLIRAAGASPCGVAIAVDRMERGLGALSAVQEVEQQHAMPVVSIVNLDDLMTYLGATPDSAALLAAIAAYRQQYGVA